MTNTPGQLAINVAWLAQGQEEALEPELAIVDAHHHLWDPPGARYLFDDYLADTRLGHKIAASVAVECHSMYRAEGPDALRPVGETEFLAGLAAQSASGRYGDTRIAAAILAHADFALGGAFEAVLHAHAAAAGGRLRGFRGRVSSHEDPDINKWQTPPGVLLQPSARAVMALIARHGLSLDIWAYQTQFDDVLATCRDFPELTIVLDHCCGVLACGPLAGRRKDMFDNWLPNVRALAESPNAVAKFSGLGMRFAGFDYHERLRPPTSDELVADWTPYFRACLDAFGPERMMFASNFPADKGSYGYVTLWNAFKKLAGDLTEGERAMLFSGTAARVYKIPR